MIEQADQNGDGVIDRGEFQQCYASLPWSRVQGLSVLLHEIKSTWRLFDENGDGSITTDELRQVFASMKLNLTVEEIDRMVVAADANGDGEISYIEFVQAFHSPQWRKARALGMAQSRLQVFESEQHKMYEELAESEKQQVLDEGEQGTIEGVDVNKTQLMRRRALRRHPAVQASIGKLWHALSALKVDGIVGILRPVEQQGIAQVAGTHDGHRDRVWRRRRRMGLGAFDRRHHDHRLGDPVPLVRD